MKLTPRMRDDLLTGESRVGIYMAVRKLAKGLHQTESDNDIVPKVQQNPYTGIISVGFSYRGDEPGAVTALINAIIAADASGKVRVTQMDIEGETTKFLVFPKGEQLQAAVNETGKRLGSDMKPLELSYEGQQSSPPR